MIENVKRHEKPTYVQNIINTMMFHPVKNAKGEIVNINMFEGFMQVLVYFWKAISCICPPVHFAWGYPCFLMALTLIGLTTFVIYQVSALLCCLTGIKPGVLAITLIAVGTSIPDVIVSWKAAKLSKHADASIGNLLGVNTATILLGYGLPWVIAIVYYRDQELPNNSYTYPRAGLLFALGLYLVLSLIGIFLIGISRCCDKQ